MEDHILKTRKVREPAFSAIYIWIDPHNEGFDSYMKKHMLRSLGWACSNEDLKERLQINNGNTELVIKQLTLIFREQFEGNINYLQEIFSIETVQTMVQLIELFIRESVKFYACQFTNMLR
ncbi:MAG: hypothetical protein ABWY16_21270 [Pedobacter sp.]|uniref:hypothetical protein n=1 Tax=Pedobacter sp. TaxID=1411316 RepID=UPI00339898CC